MSTSFARLESVHDVDPAEYEPGIPLEGQARKHDGIQSMADLNLDLGLGLSKRVAVEAFVPFRLAYRRTDFLGADGQKLSGFASIHHQDGYLAGVGDVLLAGRYRVLSGTSSTRLDARLGLSLPTGNVEDDPTAAGVAGEAHEHLFFGTGTFDPQLALDGVYDAGRFRFVGFGLVRAGSLYDGPHGYRAGARASAGAGFDVAVTEDLRLLLQPEVYHEQPSGWGANEAENSGRTELVVGGGVLWQWSPGWAALARLRVPVYTASHHGEVSVPFVVTLSVSRAVRLGQETAVAR